MVSIVHGHPEEAARDSLCCRTFFYRITSEGYLRRVGGGGGNTANVILAVLFLHFSLPKLAIATLLLLVQCSGFTSMGMGSLMGGEWKREPGCHCVRMH